MFNPTIQLDPTFLKEGVDLVRPYYHKLSPDVSSYAKGRLRAWVQAEAPLSDNQNFRKGIEDPKLWQWIQNACKQASINGFTDWKPDIALITWSGTGDDGVGISEHRDAGYSDYPAMTINLTGTCLFSIRKEQACFEFFLYFHAIYYELFVENRNIYICRINNNNRSKI